jgi:hypothetical protein
LAVRTFDLWEKSLIRTELGPEPSAKPGTGGDHSPCRAFLQAHSWDNTSPVRCQRIPPAKSFIHSHHICGVGKLGWGTIPQLTRNGLGKRPVWRPFCHCESNPSLFGVLVGGDTGGLTYLRIAAIGMLSFYLSKNINGVKNEPWNCRGMESPDRSPCVPTSSSPSSSTTPPSRPCL